MSDHLRRNPIKTFKKELSVYKRDNFTEKDNYLVTKPFDKPDFHVYCVKVYASVYIFVDIDETKCYCSVLLSKMVGSVM